MKSHKNFLMDSVFILAGSFLVAFSIAVFAAPNHIAPGGISGIATALSFMLGLTIGMLSLLLNIPLLILAWRKLGFGPLAKTIIATVALSISIDLFTVLTPPFTSDRLLAAITGGVISGIGMGLLLARGISTGGTDLIGLLIKKANPSLSMGQLLIIIDSCVVLIAVLVFKDVEVALYSVVTIFITSKCIDIIQEGVDHAKVIYIITQSPEALLQKLAHEMGRGVTVLPAKGGFSGKDKAMLMTIARRNETSSTLQAVRMIDPNAFIILSDATEVLGEGFKD